MGGKFLSALRLGYSISLTFEKAAYTQIVRYPALHLPILKYRRVSKISSPKTDLPLAVEPQDVLECAL